MASQKDQIQTLITEIESTLSQPPLRLPWGISSEAKQQRQVLEKTAEYLRTLQKVFDAPGGWGPLDPSTGQLLSSPPSERAESSAAHVLEALLMEMQYLKENALQPLRSELSSLHQQRDALKAEIQALDTQRHEQAVNPLSQQQLNAFLDSLMERLQTTLAQQVGSAVAHLEAGRADDLLLAEAVEGELVSAEQPRLHPAQRLEQLRLLQTQSDQLLLQLDSTLSVVFEALQKSIDSYQESLATGLDEMHGLGRQGEVILRSLINHLVQNVGQQLPAYQSPNALTETAAATLALQARPLAEPPVSADPLDQAIESLDLGLESETLAGERLEPQIDEALGWFPIDEADGTDEVIDGADADRTVLQDAVMTQLQSEPSSELPESAALAEASLEDEALTWLNQAATAEPVLEEMPVPDSEMDDFYQSLFGADVVGAQEASPSAVEDGVVEPLAEQPLEIPPDDTQAGAVELDIEPDLVAEGAAVEGVEDGGEVDGAAALTAEDWLFDQALSEPSLLPDASPAETLDQVFGEGLAAAPELSMVIEPPVDTIESLSELLPDAAEPLAKATPDRDLDRSASFDLLADVETDQDTYIPAPTGENLLEVEEPPAEQRPDLQLDESLLAQLGEDLQTLDQAGFLAADEIGLGPFESVTAETLEDMPLDQTTLDNLIAELNLEDEDAIELTQELSTGLAAETTLANQLPVEETAPFSLEDFIPAADLESAASELAQAEPEAFLESAAPELAQAEPEAFLESTAPELAQAEPEAFLESAAPELAQAEPEAFLESVAPELEPLLDQDALTELGLAASWEASPEADVDWELAALSEDDVEAAREPQIYQELFLEEGFLDESAVSELSLDEMSSGDLPLEERISGGESPLEGMPSEAFLVEDLLPDDRALVELGDLALTDSPVVPGPEPEMAPEIGLETSPESAPDQSSSGTVASMPPLDVINLDTTPDQGTEGADALPEDLAAELAAVSQQADQLAREMTPSGELCSDLEEPVLSDVPFPDIPVLSMVSPSLESAQAPDAPLVGLSASSTVALAEAPPAPPATLSQQALVSESLPDEAAGLVGQAVSAPPGSGGTRGGLADWFLGLDLGSTGISAVLLDRQTGQVYPLYWLDETASEPESERRFRLPVSAWLTSDSEIAAVGLAAWQAAEHAQQESTRPQHPGLLLEHLKPFMKIAIPYAVPGGKSEPLVQWSDARCFPLHCIRSALETLLATLSGLIAADSIAATLGCGGVGLDDADLQAAFRQLSGVVVGYPTNWPDTYSFNLREMILTTGLVSQPDQIFFIEDAIATILSGLPDPNTPSESQTTSLSRQPSLYGCDWSGGTLAISAGATLTELALADLPASLTSLVHRDFALRSLAYAGDSLDQDIICQLLYPPEHRKPLAEAASSPQDGHWQAHLPAWAAADWASLQLESLTLPQPGEADLVQRHRLQQRLAQSPLGQALLEAARHLKLILQHQPQCQLEVGDQCWQIKRRDLENRIFLPYIQQINRHLNVLLSQQGMSTQAVKQVICTGGSASLSAVARWLRQKFPNATIIQDTYASDRPSSCSRVAYGLVNLARYPQVLDITRQQYSDYFLLMELLRVFPQQPLPVNGIMHLLEQRGINTQACQLHILALLEGHLPPGLVITATDQPWISLQSEDITTYQALTESPLFTKERQIYIPNEAQSRRLRAHLEKIMATSLQQLDEPLIAQLAVERMA